MQPSRPRIDLESAECDLCGRIGPLKIVDAFHGDLGICSGGCHRPPVELPKIDPDAPDPWLSEEQNLVAAADFWRLD